MSEEAKEVKSLIKPKPEPLVEVLDDACWELLEPSNVSPTGLKIVRIPYPQDWDKLRPLQEAYIMSTQKQWTGQNIGFLLSVIELCHGLGLDHRRGEVYVVEGRLSTSDEAKIRCARGSGKIKWQRVSELEKRVNPATGKEDICCVATIQHTEEDEPQSYTGWLSEWKNPKNANWTQRPNDALQRKTLARLCNRMFPLGTDGDDFLEAPPTASPKALELEKALTEGLGKAELDKVYVEGHTHRPAKGTAGPITVTTKKEEEKK